MMLLIQILFSGVFMQPFSVAVAIYCSCSDGGSQNILIITICWSILSHALDNIMQFKSRVILMGRMIAVLRNVSI